MQHLISITMTNKAIESCRDKTKYNSLNNEAPETQDEKANPTKNQTYRERKSALSKREIMEELSRQRFPWEE